MNSLIRRGILGAIVGDAMGVPYEWMTPIQVKKELKDYMVYDHRRNLPSGTWSDDSSMILCTVESLLKNGTNMKDVGDSFVKWYDENHWTPYGVVFDIGGTTRDAIENIKKGNYVNGTGEWDKGNGSLMRILPLACYLHEEEIERIKETVENCSALTHSTDECKIACVWYSMLVKSILSNDYSPYSVISEAEDYIRDLYTREELQPFSRILSDEVLYLTPNQLLGTGYVVDGLEVAINCLFNSDNFRDGILRAISVGLDTDTNASIAGGLLGLTYYGDIPQSWIDELARKEDIKTLLDKIDWSRY